MNKGLVAFGRAILKPYYALVYPHRTHGSENLPEEGGFVLCINHISARDPLFITVQLPAKRHMFFMAKKELFQNKLLARILGAVGAFPVDRGNADLNAVRTAMRTVREGDALGIFPQGTRSRDNLPTPFLNGAAMIALRCRVPVIPCYIDGPYRPFHRTDVFFGRPIDFSAFGARCDNDTLCAATGMIESAVWSLGGKQLPDGKTPASEPTNK